MCRASGSQRPAEGPGGPRAQLTRVHQRLRCGQGPPLREDGAGACAGPYLLMDDRDVPGYPLSQAALPQGWAAGARAPRLGPALLPQVVELAGALAKGKTGPCQGAQESGLFPVSGPGVCHVTAPLSRPLRNLPPCLRVPPAVHPPLRPVCLRAVEGGTEPRGFPEPGAQDTLPSHPRACAGVWARRGVLEGGPTEQEQVALGERAPQALPSPSTFKPCRLQSASSAVFQASEPRHTCSGKATTEAGPADATVRRLTEAPPRTSGAAVFTSFLYKHRVGSKVTVLRTEPPESIQTWLRLLPSTGVSPRRVPEACRCRAVRLLPGKDRPPFPPAKTAPLPSHRAPGPGAGPCPLSPQEPDHRQGPVSACRH